MTTFRSKANRSWLPSDRFCLWFAAVLDAAMLGGAVHLDATKPVPWWWWAAWAMASAATVWTWISWRE